jgi:hypothetical protein
MDHAEGKDRLILLKIQILYNNESMQSGVNPEA